MADTELNHLLVRDYLRELDAALAALPARQAGELREQITTHLDDVLGPGASDQEVGAALRRLGSPRDLAAEVGAEAAAAPVPASPRPRRALLARPGRRFWALAVAVVLAAGFVAWLGVPVWIAGVLQTGGEEGWWYPQDATRQVDTVADGAQQDTVPVRVGQRQGLFFEVYNPSPWTQTVLGWAMYSVQSPGSTSTASQLSLSTRGYAHDFPGLARSDHYGLPGVIPPHSSRVIRLMWTSGHNCLSAGESEGIDQLNLSVRVGLFQRTEVVPLGGEWALSGPGGPCP